ncbi:DUF2332 domain-containing protein [Rhodococcus pyridinivorans]|uniref:DUF2332 family protein n=1 Tax=Rhodococcus TaxID=1827 RepID=UPI0007EB849F|nr:MULTISPECIES: DUF2332 family protein [Rhodococcus]APE07944.1 hypothetical protein BO226_00800 [Rhodococcus sp. 2G]MCD2116016.1 DUF2332 domain-containing protein [Rhodococcus pyridinivorans]MCZ4624880.1 DUF2332 family protein [Rhodococcus pyridinivorans]MCZ4646090.1 DUF2332 family protein [Rhodococcus pyridinivorans]MDJ0482812.1 DUF2332 family protein [Rhodococcus pyridinivorans]
MADPPRRAAVDEAGRYAVLHPAIAEAAHRAGATAIGLIDVGRPAALNLCVDRVGITYSDGVFLGDPDSPVQESCSIVHGGTVPDRAMPPVVARVAVTRRRPDVEDALLAEDPPVRFCGDVVELLPEGIAAVPEGALPVVTTTWALSRLAIPRRPSFVDSLREAAAGRTVAWVSAEGVGAAPSVPTLGDRPASGHSIVGVAVYRGSEQHVDAVGRCWSRGRMLDWFP